MLFVVMTAPKHQFSLPFPSFHSWVIYGAFNARISVTFHDFDLEESKTCAPYDVVKLSDKCNGSKVWSSLQPEDDIRDGYCGNLARFSVISGCNNMRIAFKSDDSLTGRGFNATYEIILEKSEHSLSL